MVEAWKNPFFGGSVLNPLRSKPFGKIAMGKKGGDASLVKKDNSLLEDISNSTFFSLMSIRNIKISKMHYMHLTILLTDQKATKQLEKYAHKQNALDKSFTPDRKKQRQKLEDVVPYGVIRPHLTGFARAVHFMAEEEDDQVNVTKQYQLTKMAEGRMEQGIFKGYCRVLQSSVTS